MASKREAGTVAEQQAAEYLVSKGFRIIARNESSRFGEIDLIALDGTTVVFVEVKQKSGKRFGRPEEMITAAKRRKLTRLAEFYLADHRLTGPARIDVVAVDREGLRHYRNAF